MPRKLIKSNTMQIAAEEGKSFLKRSWGEDTYNKVQDLYTKDNKEQFTQKQDSADNKDNKKIRSKRKDKGNHKKDTTELPAKKPKLNKYSTILKTTKDSEHILKDTKIDIDAKTRNQSKTIQNLIEKKVKLKPSSTMTETTKEALEFLTREPLKSRKISTKDNQEKKSKQSNKNSTKSKRDSKVKKLSVKRLVKKPKH